MFDLHEGRFTQSGLRTSAADALTLALPAVVPANKYWTLLGASYNPSATETRVVVWEKVTRGGAVIAVTRPFSIELTTLLKWPLLTEGLELVLFPGEYVQVRRSAATAGSTMSIQFQYVESDLPYYAYTDPQKKLMQATIKHGSVYRATGAISQAGPAGGEGGAGSGFGGGGGGPAEPGA
jgi:hypothetical protein